MSVLAGVISQGLMVSEALGVLDARQSDAWSRIALDWEQSYDMDLRFGSKHPDDIEGFKHRSPPIRGKWT